MKLSLIHDALVYYYDNGYPLVPKEYTAKDVLIAIEECARQDEIRVDRASLYDDMYLITSWSLVNLLSMATYDICGRLIKDNPNKGLDRLIDIYVYTMQYSHDIDLTRAALASGFDFIKDLWSCNEDMKCHRPDGSMKTFETTKLKEVLPYLEAYYITNTGHVSDDDEHNLSVLIDSIKTITKGGESNE